MNDYLLHFGEEFELLLTLDSEEYEQYREKLVDVTVIGRVNNSKLITILEDDCLKEIKIKGYEHLKDD